MDRTGVIAAVAIVLLVSGCLGLSGGDGTPDPTGASPAPTPTPTPTPTERATSTPTGTAASEPTIPGGWSESGVEDPDAALQSHYSAVLSGPSATVQYRNSVLESDASAGENSSLDMTLDPAGRRMHVRIDGQASSLEVFYADGTLTQWDPENASVAGRSEIAYQRAVQSADIQLLKSNLLLYTLNLTETVERDGTTVFVYNVSGVQPNTVSRTYGAARSGSGRVLVGADGRVRVIETTVTYTNATVAYRYAHTDLGETTVETPAWASR